MKAFYWLLKRESWEHRSFVIVPLAVGGLAILFMLLCFLKALGHLDGIVHLSGHIQRDGAVPEQRVLVTAMTILRTAMPFSVVMLIVIAVYLLDALYGDRRDRSIMFWKSLPISDTAVVLSKLTAAALVVPLITLAVVVATQLVALIIASIGFLLLGFGGWGWLWNPLGWLLGWAHLTYGYLALSLVLLPYLSWLLLASSWARRTPFLWAAVPPVALIAMERWFLGSHYLSQWLVGYLKNARPAFRPAFSLERMAAGHPSQGLMPNLALFAEPAIWVGLAVATLFVAGAIWLRRHSDET